jgi:hypothetical protein
MKLGLTIANDGEFGKAMRGRIDYGAWVTQPLQGLGAHFDPSASFLKWVLVTKS